MHFKSIIVGKRSQYQNIRIYLSVTHTFLSTLTTIFIEGAAEYRRPVTLILFGRLRLLLSPDCFVCLSYTAFQQWRPTPSGSLMKTPPAKWRTHMPFAVSAGAPRHE